MGWLGATAIGVGGMVGGGIFAVLGTAVTLAHGATPLAFLVAGSVALLTALAYARLAAHFPGAGGTVVFVNEAFGHGLSTGALNLLLWFNYVATIALYASAFGAYGGTFVSSSPGPWVTHGLVTLGIVLPAVANLLGPELIAKSETAIVVVKLVLLLLVACAGLTSIEPARLAPATWPDWGAVLAGGMTIFVAYEGFELIANAGDDVEDPRRTLPRALLTSVVFVLLLYVVLAAVTVGSVSEDVILAQQDYALAAAARPSLGPAGFTLVAVSALLATLSAINATIYGDARLGFSLARDGELPRVLAGEVKGQPVASVVAITTLSLALANGLDLAAIAIMGSAGFLLVFGVVNAAAFALSAEIGSSRAVNACGVLGCGAALVALIQETWRTHPATVPWLFGAVAGAYAIEWLLRRRRGPVQVDP